MYSDKPDSAQQWSVHAEVTISHNPPNNEPTTAPPPGVTHTEQNENGLRMVYTWTSHPPVAEDYGNHNLRPPGGPTVPPPSSSIFPSSDTASRTSNQSNQSSMFQRGGLIFTSVPPRSSAPQHNTNPFLDPGRLNLSVHDSGYNSELLSPSSCGASLPRRPILPYDRRCKSTCSIILSTAFNPDGHIKCDASSVNAQPVSYHQCGRTQSLRCQTPSIKPDRRDSYFGCGDPWCYHAEDFSNRRCSPVLESCEECSLSNQSVGSKRASRANTFTTHFCTKVPERNRSSPPSFDYRSKDMAVQTVETKDKCTSPFEKISPLNKLVSDDKNVTNGRRKITRKLSDRRKSSATNSRRNSDNLSPSSLPIDSADNKKSNKRITRSPAVVRGRSPLLDKNSPARDIPKKQRTVHIDVYCTGSDCESESESTSESDAGTHSSPQTVFESEKVRVAHRRAEDSEMPYSLRSFLEENLAIGAAVQDEQRKKLAAKLVKTIYKHGSDSEEEVSTAYPSALSSYSQFRDFESSLSSVPPSWSAMSTSSCTVPDYDATSCKDTVSDFESLVMRKFSLVPDESEYFIPRKLQQQSPDPPSENTSRVSSSSILPSDSFEYEDFCDRERIKTMERMWAGGELDQKTWKSPSSERKFMLQQQKMKEYLDKRVKEKTAQKEEVKESETESTEDDSERGWSFVQNPDDAKNNLKREVTVRRASKDALEDTDYNKTVNTDNKPSSNLKNSVVLPKITPNLGQQSKPVPSTPTPQSPFNIQPSSSCTVIRNFDSNFSTPFTIHPGKFTDPLFKAQKFGTVIGATRKPGHHVGPAKNPDCLCDHCRRFYEDSQSRGRTRSVGDQSLAVPYNWRELLKPRMPATKSMISDS